MIGLVARLVLVGFSLVLGGLAAAAEPELPPGQFVPGPIPPVYAYPAYHRVSRYDVWQYYAVDRQGQFRPRVIYSPYGQYYLYNHAPYPWAVVHPLEFMSYAGED
jgi:hypothetical protein